MTFESSSFFELGVGVLSLYLEIPSWDNMLPFRSFEDLGKTVVPPHWHKEIEIIYVKSGSAYIGYDEQLVQVREGEIFVFGSGESHYFLASPDSVRLVYQFDLLLFRDQYLEKLDYKELIRLFETSENHSVNWPKNVTVSIQEVLEMLFEESMKRRIGYEFSLIGLLHQLLVFYFREIPKKAKTLEIGNFVEAVNQKETLERLNNIFIYIETHSQENITLEDVAKHVGFSPHYFARFFKKNTGQTFIQFLTEYRISQAKSMLSKEKMPMIEVSEKSGFNSVKTFHHVFKEQVGMSPLKYHKSIFGNN